jgi:REP element-mobilizing transposase RayT
MSRKYKIWDQSCPYFISFAVVHWIDLFVWPSYRNLLVKSLRYCKKEKGLIIYGWCLMPSHMHMIIGTKRNPMENILRDFKSYTSGQLKKAIQSNPEESRREWMLRMMKRAGLKNSNNNDWSRNIGSNIIITP